MIDETTTGLHVIGTGSQGVRHMYSKKEIKNVGEIKGLKVREGESDEIECNWDFDTMDFS